MIPLNPATMMIHTMQKVKVKSINCVGRERGRGRGREGGREGVAAQHSCDSKQEYAYKHGVCLDRSVCMYVPPSEVLVTTRADRLGSDTNTCHML